MKIITYSSLFLSVILLSCNDKSVNSVIASVPTFTSQSTACVSHGLAKGTAFDSLFTYRFDQTLAMDFSVWGNCCPDSGRFLVNYAIYSDTVLITVIDSAQNWCNCVCPYLIHVEAQELPLDQYIVRCRVGDGQSFFDPAHLAIVHRTKK